MAMTLRRRAAEPIGDQIRSIILGEISSGALAPGQQLPTEKELAERFGVSLAPLRSALNDLTKAGVIERIQGKGTFVRDAMIPIKLGVLPSFTDSLRLRGVPFAVSVLDCGLAPAPAAIAEALRLPGTRAHGFRVRRLVAIKDAAAACLDAWFTPTTFDGLDVEAVLRQGGSVYRLLREQAGIVFSNFDGTITVETTAQEILELLDLPFGSPIAQVVMLGRDSQRHLLEHSTLHCDAKRFNFQVPSGQGTDGAAGRP